MTKQQVDTTARQALIEANKYRKQAYDLHHKEDSTSESRNAISSNILQSSTHYISYIECLFNERQIPSDHINEKEITHVFLLANLNILKHTLDQDLFNRILATPYLAVLIDFYNMSCKRNRFPIDESQASSSDLSIVTIEDKIIEQIDGIIDCVVFAGFDTSDLRKYCRKLIRCEKKHLILSEAELIKEFVVKFFEFKNELEKTTKQSHATKEFKNNVEKLNKNFENRLKNFEYYLENNFFGRSVMRNISTITEAITKFIKDHPQIQLNQDIQNPYFRVEEFIFAHCYPALHQPLNKALISLQENFSTAATTGASSVNSFVDQIQRSRVEDYALNSEGEKSLEVKRSARKNFNLDLTAKVYSAEYIKELAEASKDQIFRLAEKAASSPGRVSSPEKKPEQNLKSTAILVH